MAVDSKYRASLSPNRTRSGTTGWSVIFRHPQPHESYGPPGHRVRRGLGTADEPSAQRLVDQLNEILADRSLWSPTARDSAERRFPGADPIIKAFYDVLAPAASDFMALRDAAMPLPGPADGFARVLLLGTPGAGKTTLVRQLLGTDPKRERFPSTSAAKTTTADIEIVMRPGDFSAVVTFLPKEQVRVLVEDCVSAGVLAAVDGRDEEEIARRLLEHREQKFRLSYLLGNLPRAEQSADDDDVDDEAPDEGAEEIGADASDEIDLPFRLQEFVSKICELATESIEELTRDLGIAPDQATGEDRDALEELLEDSLRERDRFHELADRIMEDVEARFAMLGDGKLSARPDGWPILFSFSSDVRPSFIARVNRFSTNNARLFGRLLTPLVQGIRVGAPFAPEWNAVEVPSLVLLDGLGFGHTSNSMTSLPSETMRRLDDVDAVLLVDNAAEAMRAGPGVILKSLVTAGHQSKLRVVFTKFDLVRAANLPNMAARQNHVRASLDQAIGEVGKIVGRSAERALNRALENGVFFLSDVRKSSDDLSTFTVRQLDALLESLRTAVAAPAVAESAPVYDEANLVLAMQRAVNEFHEKWHAMLGLPSSAQFPKKHWATVKALTRWVSQLNAESYADLTPVADLEQVIRERVYVFLQNPVSWEPETRDPDMKEIAIAAVCTEVNARLRDFALRRVIADRYQDWADAFAKHAGTGSTRRRARAIDDIYDVAAPVPGETPDRYGNDFLKDIRVLVRDAIKAANGKVLNVVP